MVDEMLKSINQIFKDFNLNSKKHLLLFWMFFCYIVSAQVVVIDTTNQQFRTDFASSYKIKSKETLSKLENIEDRKARNYIVDKQKDFSTSFAEKIKKGEFVNDKRYNDLAGSIFLEIQKANPEIPNIKFLFSIDNEPNAYNFGEEIVVVYLKLIQKLESRAELAVIMCHEIAHNMLQHSKKGLLKSASKIFSDETKQQTKAIIRQKYNKGEAARDLTKKMIYGNRKETRKCEIEADSLGYKFFEKSYKNQNHLVLQVLNKLEKIDIESDSLVAKDFETFFGSTKQPFKQSWVSNTELQGYVYNKTPKFYAVDSLKTHPDCADRIVFIKKSFPKITEQKPIVDETFLKFRNNTKYDVVVGLHFQKNYGESLYETLKILKKEPENNYLKKMVYDNLTKIQEAQNKYTLAKNLETIDPKFSDSYNLFLYFIRQLRKVELNNIIENYKY